MMIETIDLTGPPSSSTTTTTPNKKRNAEDAAMDGEPATKLAGTRREERSNNNNNNSTSFGPLIEQIGITFRNIYCDDHSSKDPTNIERIADRLVAELNVENGGYATENGNCNAALLKTHLLGGPTTIKSSTSSTFEKHKICSAAITKLLQKELVQEIGHLSPSLLPIKAKPNQKLFFDLCSIRAIQAASDEEDSAENWRDSGFGSDFVLVRTISSRLKAMKGFAEYDLVRWTGEGKADENCEIVKFLKECCGPFFAKAYVCAVKGIFYEEDIMNKLYESIFGQLAYLMNIDPVEEEEDDEDEDENEKEEEEDNDDE